MFWKKTNKALEGKNMTREIEEFTDEENLFDLNEEVDG